MSTSSGYQTRADAVDSFAIGTFNPGGGDPVNWVGTDPVFEIGNGSSHAAESDAMRVLKNGNTTIYGADSELPNQTLVNSHSILTESLGDSRYVLNSDSFSAAGGTTLGMLSLAIGYGAAASGSEGSIAVGDGATASSIYATALGPGSSATAPNATAFTGALASGIGSVAFEMATASGFYAVAFSGGQASGNYSTAFNGGWAAGSGSVAVGIFNTASGNYSTASGYCSTAGADESFVIGTSNVGGGTAGSPSPTDPVFEIGNGSNEFFSYTGAPSGNSDAFVVHRNGDTVVSGTLSVTGSNPVLVYPAGDISMGSGSSTFMAGPTPAPN